MKIRKQEQVDAIRSQILEVAQSIMQEEGIEKLSMRKIANKMDYTQGSLYHYFKNKDEILFSITKQGYGEIIAILQACAKEDDIKRRLSNTLKQYMKAMMNRADIFMILMQSEDEAICSQVDLLKQGIRNERASIASLCNTIEQGVSQGIFICEQVELRAQSIWCATFGCISRILKEKIEGAQKDALINEHCKMILQSLEVKG